MRLKRLEMVSRKRPTCKVLCKVPGTKLEHNLKGSYDFVSLVTYMH